MLALGQRRMRAVPALVLIVGSCGGRALSFDGGAVTTDDAPTAAVPSADGAPDIGRAGAMDGAIVGDAGTGILYASAVVNPINSGDDVRIWRLDPSGPLCVLVDAFIEVPGRIRRGPTAIGLPFADGCLTTGPIMGIRATVATGTISFAGSPLRMDFDLHLEFPPGYAWLPAVLEFRARGVLADGKWHAAAGP